MATMPTDVTYGKVTGRFLTAVGDGPDGDTLPDAAVPTGLTVKFTPKAGVFKTTSPSVTVVPKPITCTLDTDGNLLDPQNVFGVWLIAGLYSVTYAGASDFTLSGHEVEVTTAHTALSPLDLTVAMPPGVILTPTQYTELNGRITVLEESPGGGGGVTDHGALTGLADDDHAQYHTDTRGDARYYTKTANDALLAGKQATGDYATNTALTAGLATKAATLGSDDNYVTDAEKVKLGNLSGTNTGDQTLPTWSTLSGKPATFAPTIGATSTTAVAGDDARLTDARTPTTHTHTASQVSDSTTTGRALLTAADAAAARTTLALGTAATTAATAYATAAQGTKADTAVQPARAVSAGTGLTGGGDLSADRTLSVAYGTSAGTATQGNDARIGKINGTVAVSGTPTAGQTVVASSGTAAAWGPPASPDTYVFASVDTANSTVTAADATGLAIPALADGTYEFEVLAICSSTATTTGAQVGLGTAPSGATVNVGGNAVGSNNATVIGFWPTNAQLPFSAPSTGAPSTTGTFVGAIFKGVIVAASMASALAVTIKSEVAASSVSIKAGSYIRYRKVA